ncbi:MAG: glutamine synthetase, partial [Pseudomonadota bacterium]
MTVKKKLSGWLDERGVEEVECLVPDMGGVARGKITPAKKFVSGIGNQSLRMPEEIFILTVTGRYVQEANVTRPEASDIYLKPDASSIRMVPWYAEPTAQVICDCFYLDDSPVDISPRYVLQRVLKMYEDKGWKPVVAPELEFYLVEKNSDPDYPLEPPVGR